MHIPARGFPQCEFEMRTLHLQEMMWENKLDAILLTTEPNVRYYSGFLTQFWQSPTRPWFLVIPAQGKPIAVIPEIGAAGMASTWIEDIRTWASPRPEDDGISILVDLLNSLPKQFGHLGVTLGAESHLRMPMENYIHLVSRLDAFVVKDVAPIIQAQRMVKSPLEIEKTKYICQLASRAFETIRTSAKMAMTESEIVRNFKIALLKEGADSVSYVVAGSGPGGYESIIMGPSERALRSGDLLIIDTGSTYDGYFCDFDRNWAFGEYDAQTGRAYEVVWHATQAGFRVAKPGATTSDVWYAMNKVMVEGGSLGNEVGRLGHGLGIELTERPSNTASDHTVLKVGMIITLEPGMTFAHGKQMVHEENIVITETGAEWLTIRAPIELPVIEG